MLFKRWKVAPQTLNSPFGARSVMRQDASLKTYLTRQRFVRHPSSRT